MAGLLSALVRGSAIYTGQCDSWWSFVLLQLERPHTYPPFLIDGEAPHPPLCASKSCIKDTRTDIWHSKFCVCVSGFKSPGSLSTEIFGTSFSTPTLHVIGRNDVVVIEEWSKTLIEISQNKRVEEHVGGQLILRCVVTRHWPCYTGHFVPLSRKWREIFRDYFVNPLGRSPPSTLLPCRDSAAITSLKPIGIRLWHPRTRLRLVYSLVSSS